MNDNKLLFYDIPYNEDIVCSLDSRESYITS